MNINEYAKFHHTIPFSSRDRAIFTFSEFGARQSLDRWKMSFCNLLGYILLISVFTQKFIKIFHSVQKIGYFHFFRIWRSAKPRPMINVISQSLGLDVVNINAYAKFYQNIPNGLELSSFFTNRSVTKSSQTVWWQNQMFDYRALYESQPLVSVDFLRVVQYFLYSLGRVYTKLFKSSIPKTQKSLEHFLVCFYWVQKC